MDQYFFIIHQIGRNVFAHTVAETLNFKPHQKYFHEYVFFFQEHSWKWRPDQRIDCDF
jgi:uncharacterized phage-like protein YoqJ